MDNKTPIYERHIAAKGKLVSFAGYQLPMQYETGIIAEHMAVRERAGLFDVSHMGEIMITGKDALYNIQRLVTNDCSKMCDGQVKYSPMCNEDGGIIDDLLIYRRAEDSYLLVVNASNRHKDVRWINDKLTGDVALEDISDKVAQLALQGPDSSDLLMKLVDKEMLPKKYYTFKEDVNIAGVLCLVSRTGYTGEDGFEIYCSSEEAIKLWDLLLETGNPDLDYRASDFYVSKKAIENNKESFGLIPCGLGARDTLRLEAGMPLYGNEMSDDITPIEAGLNFTVKLDKEDFIGKEALLSIEKPEKTRVGLRITGRGIARKDCNIYLKDKIIGKQHQVLTVLIWDIPLQWHLLIHLMQKLEQK